MNWFGNLKMSSKLGISFAFLIVALAGVGAWAAMRIHMVGDASKHITADELPSIVALMDMNTNASDLRLAMFRELEAASREQSSGIDQVNRAVMQMDEVTQQNAALVEEAAAASQSVAEQARTLSKTMQRYRLDDSAPMAAVRPVQSSGAAPGAQRKSGSVSSLFAKRPAAVKSGTKKF